jgi:hypothetical protein
MAAFRPGGEKCRRLCRTEKGAVLKGRLYTDERIKRRKMAR